MTDGVKDLVLRKVFHKTTRVWAKLNVRAYKVRDICNRNITMKVSRMFSTLI